MNSEGETPMRFLFWDNRRNPYITQQGNNYNGDHYARYNLISPTGTAAAIGPGQTGYSEVREPNGLVAVGSAVMARLKEEVESGQIILNNEQRATEIGVNFFGKNNPERDRYWFTMETTEGLSIMNAVVYFEGGDDAYALDDSKTSNASDNIYTMVDDKRLSIQGKSVFEMSDSIKVGFRVFKNSNAKIRLFRTEGVFEEVVNIYLRDKLKNRNINLSEVDHYLFETLDGTFNDRFIIFYSPNDMAIPDDPMAISDLGSSDLMVYKQGNQTVVNSSNLELSEIAIYNIQGQLLYTNPKLDGKIFRFDNDRFGKQTLVLKVKTTDGKEHGFKVLTC